MIEKSSFTMPKTAFFILYLFCGNFILSGKTADQCPKNPLAPTNSISGMVVGVIVGTEKVVNGVMSYFFYLGVNSVNQVLTVSSQFEGYLSQLTIKIHNFASGLIGGVGGQLKTIYSGSSGSIRILFDSIIKLENSVQSFAYKQVESFSDKVVSGKLTGEITSVIKSPFSSIGSGLKKVKSSVSKLSSNVGSEIKKMTDSVKTSGIPSDIKGIIGAPVKGVKEFSKEAQSVIQTVKNETSQRFSGYSSEFKNGGIIGKFVAAGSVPVGVGMEIWSFGLKISDAAVKSVSVSTKDIVQPFLGQVLTERLGTVVMLPMHVTEGFYKSTLNFFSQIGGIISKITGGGSVSVQINMVMKHPIVVLENVWSTTKQELKDFSKATLGEGLTEQLSSTLSSPEKAISKIASSLTSSQIGSTLYSVVSTPMMYLEKGYSQIKMTIRGITKGIIGEKLTSELSNVLNAPGKSLSHFTASITGGGSIGQQLKIVLSRPLQTIGLTLSALQHKIEGTITSITGGGSLGTQISTVLTKPTTLFKNVWNTSKKTMGDISNTLVGKGLTDKIGQTISSPLSSLSNMTASITGGGSLGTQIKSIFTKPVEIFQNLWEKTKSSTESLSKTLLGGGLTGSLGKLVSSPVASASKLYKSVSSSLSGLFHGFGASINVSTGGSAGGGIGGALSSLIEAPMDVLKGTFKGAQKAEKSIMSGLKGFYEHLPIIGKGASVKANVKLGGKGTTVGMSLGGGAGGDGGVKNTQLGGQKGVSAQGKLSGGAKSRRRRRIRSISLYTTQ
ncbi:uncharacterized protein LOC123313469 [Coccinella septempunctata]|uniref:uncharacterized protein LOC123313469 n=1 Tax=Coccinella septempunctata TaxID=41139 RepID=UPI001D08F0DF|nr:uncharacterized protein LOC123313469 [Coccinella septempunctata]